MEFVAHGADHVLRDCDLPARSCSGQTFVLRSREYGSSNDEDRSIETLALPGLVATVIFPIERPKDYYLATVEIDSVQHRSLFGLAPGVDRVAVLAKLGPPNAGVSEGCDRYFNDEIESHAFVCYRGDTVSRIRWDYFVD